MEVTQITAVIGAAASLLCTLVVGALTFFIKKTLTSLEEADKKNAAQIAESKKEAAAQIAEAKREAADKIAKVDEKLNDLKADLPLVYVTREDYIRVMNRVEDKLDQILYGKFHFAGACSNRYRSLPAHRDRLIDRQQVCT